MRDPVQGGQKSVHASRLKTYLNIEDKQFQQMVVDSGVSFLFQLS